MADGIHVRNPLHAATLERFNADTVERVKSLGKTLHVTGMPEPQAAALIARTYMAVLYDLFEPGLAFEGAFVAVAAQFAAETVVQKRNSRSN